MNINVLVIEESSIPNPFTVNVQTGSRIRLIQSIAEVNKIIVIARKGSDYVGTVNGPREHKVKVVHIPLLRNCKTPLYYLLAFLTGLRIVNRVKIHIISTESFIWSGIVGIILSKICKIPCTVDIRANYDDVIKYYYKFIPFGIKRCVIKVLARFVLKRCNHIFPNSRYNYEKCIAYGINPEKVTILNPGVRFVEKIPKKKHRIFTVGFLGRLIPVKGVDYLLKAVHYLIYDLKFTKFRVLIAGDGPERKNLEEMSRKLNVTNYVKFVGMVPSSKKYEWLSKFDVLVSPYLSLPELGMVNVEAYSCKIPVIAFGKNNHPETVLNGQTGFIIPIGDYKQLAEKILFLYQNEALRRKMGERGYKFALENFAVDKQSQKLRKVYIKLLQISYNFRGSKNLE